MAFNALFCAGFDTNIFIPFYLSTLSLELDGSTLRDNIKLNFFVNKKFFCNNKMDRIKPNITFFVFNFIEIIIIFYVSIFPIDHIRFGDFFIGSPNTYFNIKMQYYLLIWLVFQGRLGRTFLHFFCFNLIDFWNNLIFRLQLFVP